MSITAKYTEDKLFSILQKQIDEVTEKYEAEIKKEVGELLNAAALEAEKDLSKIEGVSSINCSSELRLKIRAKVKYVYLESFDGCLTSAYRGGY